MYNIIYMVREKSKGEQRRDMRIEEKESRKDK